jgi:hypothetical protein
MTGGPKKSSGKILTIQKNTSFEVLRIHGLFYPHHPKNKELIYAVPCSIPLIAHFYLRIFLHHGSTGEQSYPIIILPM